MRGHGRDAFVPVRGPPVVRTCKCCQHFIGEGELSTHEGCLEAL